MEIAIDNPDSGETELVNTSTGAVRQAGSISPDVGFENNPGKDWWRQTDKIIRDRLKSYPPELARLVEAELMELIKGKTS